ncbi:MAG TPA: hypothetical protein VMB75_09435 [Rhodocyclaceae bacterium]|nr:hypothetical protein [Rhodocyclaceae bacterium]
MMNRRSFLKAGLALTPIAAALAACGRGNGWPEGMQEIVWDRDTCSRCSMVISDRRFAAEARSPEGAVAKFDDIGCAVFWLKDKPWGEQARLWVADAAGKGGRWLDARTAQYIGGRTSPMGYNFAAAAHPEPGSLGFADLRQHLLAKGK